MDAQLKKGLLDIIVLSALFKGDSYGYKIIQDVSEVLVISESTLYPILRRLEVQGLMETYNLEYGGRLRKYYKLNPAGRQKVINFAEEWLELRKAYDFVQSNIA
jgi:Predicted transcriptional regulators